MTELLFQEIGSIDYLDAWELQRTIHEQVWTGDDAGRVLLLEHPPVFTAGRRTPPEDRPDDPGGAPVIDVDRGGTITFHGPGQLVGYPIVPLPDHVKIVDYVRRVEEALILACAELGVTTGRFPGRTGVWVPGDDRGPERKIAAIGIRVRHGIPMHGFALNCDVDLSWFDRIVPCSIADAAVTSLSAELDRDVPVAEALPLVRRHLADLLSWQPYEKTPDYEARPRSRTRPEGAAPDAFEGLTAEASPAEGSMGARRTLGG